jgi:hypothetical protein
MGVRAFLSGLGLGLLALGGVKAYDAHRTGVARAAAQQHAAAASQRADSLQRQLDETSRHAHGLQKRLDDAAREAAESEAARKLQLQQELENPPYKTTSTGTDDLEKMLEAIPHTYRTDWGGLTKPQYTEVPANVRQLTLFQQGRVYQLLTALQNDKAFRQSIGKVLEADIADTKSEHGGIIVYEGAALRLQRHPPTKHAKGKGPDGKEVDPNHFYIHPETLERSFRQPDYFADYHNHALSDDSTIYAGPGTYDFQSIFMYAQKRGDATGVVFTKLPGKKFNVDIYFPTVKKSLFSQTANCVTVDAGDWTYE